jgi:hypothetical protein
LLGDLAGTALLAGTQMAFKSRSARLPTKLSPLAPNATPHIAPSGGNASEDLFAAMMEGRKIQITDTQAIEAGASLLRAFATGRTISDGGFHSESIFAKGLLQEEVTGVANADSSMVPLPSIAGNAACRYLLERGRPSS